MQIYKDTLQTFLAHKNELQGKYNRLSIYRVLLVAIAIFAGYIYFGLSNIEGLIIMIIAIILFLVMMRQHQKIASKIEVKKQLIKINEDEISFITQNEFPYKNGNQFKDGNHFYSYDLDFFGEHSLFQYLNRTATFIGEKTLAHLLQSLLPHQEIIKNQNAIAELQHKIDWRQKLNALGKINNDNKVVYNKLLRWANSSKNATVSGWLIPIAYILGALFLVSFIGSFIIKDIAWLNFSGLIFFINLAITFSQFKKIKQEIESLDGVDRIVKQYGIIIEHIEEETFKADKNVALKNELLNQNVSVGALFKRLGALFANMDGVLNLIIAILFNGTVLYHLHTLHALLKWKKNYADYLPKWLGVIGEFEALNSLSNFAYNNPKNVFPTLNESHQISFEELGHPLIKKSVRVCNSIDFNQQQFIVLTGSNMSGKSTFLRSLGLNMVLAGIGSVVCANQANVHAIPVYVSMRVDDSLSDNTSFFFAEVKRLKKLMTELQTKKGFVLLDEILRGTNSDDKRSGTIQVIKKLMAYDAIGGIATHDLEICNTTKEYPNFLMNKCFEVEIVNNDLDFDYKLRDGICQNQSASFLMKKMEII